jgi:flagellar biosynthesis protein FlhF
MKFRRFTGRDAREAMERVRAALGSEAIILKNRSIPGGIEILATIDDPGLAEKLNLDARTASELAPTIAEDRPPTEARVLATTRSDIRLAEVSKRAPEMSTVSFQQYLRDRVVPPSAELASLQPAEPPTSRELCFPPVPQSVPQPAANEAELMGELRSMQGMLASHLSSMAWLDGVRRNPLQTQVLRHLMACGFSGGLARRLADRLPAHMTDRSARAWLADRLQKVIQIDAPGQSVIDHGGIYALTGPTGVGKTTTIAKLAAQFAMRHGTNAIGLVSVDAYRIGAQDQLRAFGRLLGVPVMVAHDAVSLAEFLHVYMRKKLVLIDTVGFGQNDARVLDQLRALQHAPIQRLLVLNASAQSEVMQQVIAAFKGDGLRGVVISKLDEAVKTGAVLDAVIRHRMPVIGVADGQRVPEDWQLTDAAVLVARALSAPLPNAVELDDNEMTMLLQSSTESGSLHA